MVVEGQKSLQETREAMSRTFKTCHWSREKPDRIGLGDAHNRRCKRSLSDRVTVTKNSPRGAGVSEVFGRGTVNSVTATSREAERLTRLEALGVMEKCAIFYSHASNLEFLRKNKATVVNMAHDCFSKKSSLKFNKTLKCKKTGNGAKTTISFGDDEGSDDETRLVVNNTKHLTTETLTALVNPEECSNQVVRDLTGGSLAAVRTAEYSPLRRRLFRLNSDLPVYLLNNHLFQLSLDGSLIEDSVMIEGSENQSDDDLKKERSRKSTEIAQALRRGDTTRERDKLAFKFPFTFQRLASDIASSSLGRMLYNRGPSSVRTSSTVNNERSVVEDGVRSSLVNLLASHRRGLKLSTVSKYFNHFLRFYLFCAAVYFLNENAGLHSTVFSTFNLKLYLYAHGPRVKRRTLLSAAKLFNTHLFQMNTSTPDARNVQAFIDEEYHNLNAQEMKHVTMGKPSKVSVHTRTINSTLALLYCELEMGRLLLEKMNAADSNRKVVEEGLRTAAETLIFLFASLVYFNRWSDAKPLSNVQVLQLCLGQPLILDSKAKAVSLVKLSQNPLGMRGNARIRDILKEPAESVDDDRRSNVAFVDSESMAATALNVASPCVLGLPYAVQACLGIPPSVSCSFVQNVVAANDAEAGVRYSECCGASGSDETSIRDRNSRLNLLYGFDLELPLPPADRACIVTDFFRNNCSASVNEYYRADVINHCLEALLRPEFHPSHADVNDDQSCVLKRLANVGSFDASTWTTKKRLLSVDIDNLRLSRQHETYLRSLPYRDVCVVTKTTHPDTDAACRRVLSLGDLAVAAVRVKLGVLGEKKDDDAISISDATMKKVTESIIVTDLVNFGLGGSFSGDERDTCHTLLADVEKTLAENVKKPKELRVGRAQLKRLAAKLRRATREHEAGLREFMDDDVETRLALATIYYAKNVRTRTHVGRVTGASWIVQGIKGCVVTERESELAELRRTNDAGRNTAEEKRSASDDINDRYSTVFITMFRDMGQHHLCHSNFHNTVQYYSENCVSNEDVHGLRGYLARAKGASSDGRINDSALLLPKKTLNRKADKRRNVIYGKYADNSLLINTMVKYWFDAGAVNCRTTFLNDAKLSETRLQSLWTSRYDPRLLLGGVNVRGVDSTGFYHYRRPSRLLRVENSGSCVGSVFRMAVRRNPGDKNEQTLSDTASRTPYLRADYAVPDVERTAKRKRRRTNYNSANISDLKAVLQERRLGVVLAGKKVAVFSNPNVNAAGRKRARDLVNAAELITNFDPAATALPSCRIKEYAGSGVGSCVGDVSVNKVDAARVGVNKTPKASVKRKYTLSLGEEPTSHRLASHLFSSAHDFYHKSS